MSEHPVGERALVLGWSSVRDGEATAGDVLSMRAVASALEAAGVGVDVAWSAVMAPPGGLVLEDADPARYSHVVWACGPLHGAPVVDALGRFPHAVTVAAGVSVVDPEDPAVRAVAHLLPRDAPGAAPRVDLAAAVAAAAAAVPVLGVCLAPGQGEYGPRRRHEPVTAALESWLGGLDAACVPLGTRLDPRSWRDPSSPEAVTSVVSRLDAVVTTRLHGLVLALARGVPVLAVDPVAGGGKVTAQAAAWGWPAVLGSGDLSPAALDAQLGWCLSGEGRAAAAAVAAAGGAGTGEDLAAVVAVVRGTG